jgi:hypothetical protein
MTMAEEDVAERWRYYEQIAGVERSIPEPVDPQGQP